jgi:hypothetical protein
MQIQLCEAGNRNASCALRSPRLDRVARVVCFRASPTFLFVTAMASSGMAVATNAPARLEIAFTSQMINGGHDSAAGDAVLLRQIAG